MTQVELWFITSFKCALDEKDRPDSGLIWGWRNQLRCAELKWKVSIRRAKWCRSMPSQEIRVCFSPSGDCFPARLLWRHVYPLTGSSHFPFITTASFGAAPRRQYSPIEHENRSGKSYPTPENIFKISNPDDSQAATPFFVWRNLNHKFTHVTCVGITRLLLVLDSTTFRKILLSLKRYQAMLWFDAIMKLDLKTQEYLLVNKGIRNLSVH